MPSGFFDYFVSEVVLIKYFDTNRILFSIDPLDYTIETISYKRLLQRKVIWSVAMRLLQAKYHQVLNLHASRLFQIKIENYNSGMRFFEDRI